MSTTKLILGPCAIETLDHAISHAKYLKTTQDMLKAHGYDVEVIYKSCYNKANRSSKDSFRGVGLKRGKLILDSVKQDTDLKVISDVHTKEEIDYIGETLDIIQIPAHICRYTELIEHAAKTGKSINVKMGQFLSPQEARHIIEKIRGVGNTEEIIITNRGFQFGYNNLVVDPRSFPILKELGDCSTCIDATHSIQLPGALENQSGGEPKFIETIACAGAGAGADYLFMEVHKDPLTAPCDGPSMCPLHCVYKILIKFLAIKGVVNANIWF